MLKIVTANPTYEKSKKLKPEFEIVDLYSEIIIFGGVPIVVFIPPKIQPKANVIRNLDGCQSIFWQIFKVIGNKIGDRDHSTILYYINKLDKLKKEDNNIENDINNIRSSLV